MRHALAATAAIALLAMCGAPRTEGQARSGVSRADERLVERALSRADDALRRGRTERALSLLEASARRVPRDARAPLRFCEIAVPESDATVTARVDGSDTLARDAARCASLLEALTGSTDPLDTHVAELLAWSRALLGDRGPALARVARHPLDERDVAPLRRLATLAVVDGDANEAAIALTLARRVRPHDLELLEDLAAIELSRGNAASAVTLFRAIVAARPGDRDAMHDLAGACLQAGENTAAVRYLEQLARDQPDRASAWIDLARARIELGDVAGASSDAQRALALADPGDASAAIVLGEALRLSGDVDGARRAYEEALRREPSSALARRALASIDASR
ncbi:MAG: tetratricopeptide repeat protein [Sandaracinaceae bacterium]|nr:tetratricopeptide repeat protein [Sandaracinaceae bacterium]